MKTLLTDKPQPNQIYTPIANELRQLNELLVIGVLTKEEFDIQKAKLLTLN